MESNLPNVQNPEPNSAEEQEPLVIAPSSLPPFASFSLTLSTVFPNLPQFFLQPRISTLFSQQPNKVKVPTQASSLTHVALSTSTNAVSSPKVSFKSTISSNPFQCPYSLGPGRPCDPSNGAILRRATIVWFRNDLRVHDNECLNSANDESISVLPVYCFDPRDYGKSASGFDKTGPFRAQFLIESVSNLRKTLQARGSELIVRVGKPEAVLLELAKAVGADALFAHREISKNEANAEEKLDAAMKEEGVEVKYFWGSTLYHLEDLPFKLEQMPSNFGRFKEKVKGLEIRKAIAALEQLKGTPTRGDVEPGEIPTLRDLGLNPSARISQNGKPGVYMTGGETEALQRLQKFASDCQAQLRKGNPDGSHNSISGANFSCKISPWLAMGCISPRSMFEELKAVATQEISASTGRNNGGNASGNTGLNWLTYELLWRDFFRFITKKYSSVERGGEVTPATVCTGSLV